LRRWSVTFSGRVVAQDVEMRGVKMKKGDRITKVFGNRTALDVMLGGELTDLMRVRRYLDAERGAW
jgi:hypothetical protein